MKLTKAVAFSPGVSGCLGSGQRGRTETRSQPAFHHDHDLIAFLESLTDSEFTTILGSAIRGSRAISYAIGVCVGVTGLSSGDRGDTGVVSGSFRSPSSADRSADRLAECHPVAPRQRLQGRKALTRAVAAATKHLGERSSDPGQGLGSADRRCARGAKRTPSVIV
jgi:hypothetical protein